MQGFIVVSGLPATGKTTVAAALARLMGLPSFDKDAFLEELFPVEGTVTPAVRRELSKQADARFQAAAAAQDAAVLSSWWKHPSSEVDSGTPTAWLTAPPGVTAEVYCLCSVSVAAERFLRRRRHPGHLDGRWSRASLLAMLEEQLRLGPLFRAKAIVVNTERDVDLQELVRRIVTRTRRKPRADW